MENKAKYTLVGIFVLIFTIAMVIFILWLARYDVEELNAKEFRIYSKNSIAGLNKNSIVEYKGLDIGSVEDIRIDPENLEQIEIVLKITKPNIIKIDSYAIVQSQGVTGNKLIEIDGGKQNSPNLLADEKAYAILPLKKSFIDELTSSAGNISSQVENVLKKIDLLLNEKNIENIENILINSNSSTKNLDKMLIKLNSLLEKELPQTFKNVNNMTKSINTLVKKDASNSLKNIDKMSNNFNDLSKNLNELLKNDVRDLIKELKKTAKSSQDIDKVLNNLEQTLEKVDSTIEDFNSNGGNLFFKTRDNRYGPGEEQ